MAIVPVEPFHPDGSSSSATTMLILLPPLFILQLCQASDPLHDLALLQYYAKEWDRYTTGANYVNRLFTYLNRHWVKREKDEGRKGVYGVYTVSRLAFPLSFDCR